MIHQVIPNVKLVVHSEGNETMKHNLVYKGYGMLSDEGMLVEQECFEFVVKQATDHSRHNPIIYKGHKLTCRLRQDGRYAVTFLIDPRLDLDESLKRVLYETKATYRAVDDDIFTREVCHEI